jgi:hypothetical protein
LLQTGIVVGIGIANEDAEAIAVQMPGLELVPVPGIPQQADAVAVEISEICLDRRRDRNVLPRDRVAIFQPCCSHFSIRNAEPFRYLPLKYSAPCRLLDPEKQMLAVARRLMAGISSTSEILWQLFDATADSGNAGSQQRRRYCIEQIHGTASG